MDKKKLQAIANAILLIGFVLTIIGAIYIAVSFHQYAISGCFGVVAALMLLMLLSSKKSINKKDK